MGTVWDAKLLLSHEPAVRFVLLLSDRVLNRDDGLDDLVQ